MSEQQQAPPQWNVIIDHNSRDYERHKQVERHKEQLRKIAYKQALDENLTQKKMMAHDDKQEDRRIFESMISKNRTLDELEEQKKMGIRQRMREIAQDNKRRMAEDPSRDSVLQREAMQTLVSIPIGNPEEDSSRRESNKKEMLDFYNQHVQEKRMRELREKERDRQLLDAQRDLASKEQERRQRERQRILSHGQNQQVFRYYNSLNQLGMRKQHELNVKLVDQAANSNRQRQEQRQLGEQMKRQRQLQEVKKSILDQIQHNRELKLRSEQERNHQTIVHKLAEGELSNRGQTYSKQDYLAFLMKQEELHKRRKSQEKGMNSNEYQLNLQDLQNAVRGASVHNSSPLYIGYGGQQEMRKDQIYFKPPPQSSSRSHRTATIPEDSLDEYQRQLNRSIAQRLKPSN